MDYLTSLIVYKAKEIFVVSEDEVAVYYVYIMPDILVIKNFKEVMVNNFV